MAQTTAELGQLITRTTFELFDFDYRVDDPAFKADLEQKILDYYWFYEIGTETPDAFKHRFKTRFLRAIPYYNELYNTTLLQYDPLINSRMTEALEELANTNSTQNTTGSNNNTTTIDSDSTNDNTTTNNLTTTTNGSTTEKTSDYPQQAIGAGDYLNGAKEGTNDNTTSNTGTVKTAGTNTNNSTTTSNGGNSDLTTVEGTNDRSYSKTVEGLTGTSYQELIRKERENLIRIPNMIIAELKPCFILVH